RAIPSSDQAAFRRASKASRSRISGPTSTPLERQPVRALGGDHARVDADEAEPAEQPGVLDLHATVHHNFETGLPCLFRRTLVDDADLHPDDLRADRYRFLDDRGDVVRLAKNVDDVDLSRDFPQGRVALLAEDLGVGRIDWDHAVAVLLEVLGGEEAR